VENLRNGRQMASLGDTSSGNSLGEEPPERLIHRKSVN
jgi:hypothetical protein